MMPHLNDLQISLYTEQDVDNLISYLPGLEYLNNLSVERSERQFSEISQNTK
jgi:hypothetical protein